MQFKGSARSIPDIAGALDVGYVIDGSVSQDSSNVRINASLVDARRNAPVWSTSVTRERKDVMALQRDVALSIAQAIAVTLSPQDRSRLAPAHTVNPAAFELYIKGTQARYEASFNGDLAKPKRFFEQSISEDSTYAPPYAGLAFVYTFMGDTTHARQYVNRALQLDPTLADARVALGLIRQLFDWNLSAGDSALREAVRLNPGHAEAYHELSMLLARVGRFDDAEDAARHALDLAPMSARFVSSLGEVTAYAGRTSEALAVADRLVTLDSASSALYYFGASRSNSSGSTIGPRRRGPRCARDFPHNPAARLEVTSATPTPPPADDLWRFSPPIRSRLSSAGQRIPRWSTRSSWRWPPFTPGLAIARKR